MNKKPHEQSNSEGRQELQDNEESFRLQQDISKKECRDALAKRDEVQFRVSTRVLNNAYLISGDVYKKREDWKQANVALRLPV
ncbi:MAG: hypothetical protein V7K69_19090 [Nostoc sp.]|uniref:hypothetical protein n=1 Tax=Nostoc sp. TaxID=1180 RepID=UPI002FF87252